MSKKHELAASRSGRRTNGAVLARKKIEFERGCIATVDVNCAESPLSWLHTRKDALGNSLISDEQYCAGLRLHADFTASQLMAHNIELADPDRRWGCSALPSPQ